MPAIAGPVHSDVRPPTHPRRRSRHGSLKQPRDRDPSLAPIEDPWIEGRGRQAAALQWIDPIRFRKVDAHLRVDSGSGDHLFEPVNSCTNAIDESSLVPARDHEFEVMLL